MGDKVVLRPRAYSRYTFAVRAMSPTRMTAKRVLGKRLRKVNTRIHLLTAENVPDLAALRDRLTQEFRNDLVMSAGLGLVSVVGAGYGDCPQRTAQAEAALRQAGLVAQIEQERSGEIADRMRALSCSIAVTENNEHKESRPLGGGPSRCRNGWLSVPGHGAQESGQFGPGVSLLQPDGQCGSAAGGDIGC